MGSIGRGDATVIERTPRRPRLLGLSYRARLAANNKRHPGGFDAHSSPERPICRGPDPGADPAGRRRSGQNPHRLDHGAGVARADAVLKPGIAKHNGKSYTFEPTNFASSNLQITAISQGEIDIAAFGYTSFPLAIQNGGLADLRIIADEIQDGAPGYYSTPYFVRKDSGIEKIEDMKGKVAATNGLGSGVDIAMRSALNKHGLQVTRDYTMIEAPFPAHKAILKEKKADLVVGVLPFSYDPELNEFARPLFKHPIRHRQHRAVVLGGAQGLRRQESRALVDLMEDYGAVLRWYYDRQPQGGGRAHRGLSQAPAGRLRELAVHQQGLLPRS